MNTVVFPPHRRGDGGSERLACSPAHHRSYYLCLLVCSLQRWFKQKESSMRRPLGHLADPQAGTCRASPRPGCKNWKATKSPGWPSLHICVLLLPSRLPSSASLHASQSPHLFHVLTMGLLVHFKAQFPEDSDWPSLNPMPTSGPILLLITDI